MRNLNIKIPGLKRKTTNSKTARWITGTFCVFLFVGFLFCFSDLSSQLAHVVFTQSSVSPVIRWLLVSLALAVCVLGCYVFIDVLRHGDRRKRRQKDEHDA